MIECYLTKDGEIWNPDSVTKYEDVFKDRDPRMTMSILTPGNKMGRRNKRRFAEYRQINLHIS